MYLQAHAQMMAMMMMTMPLTITPAMMMVVNSLPVTGIKEGISLLVHGGNRENGDSTHTICSIAYYK